MSAVTFSRNKKTKNVKIIYFLNFFFFLDEIYFLNLNFLLGLLRMKNNFMRMKNNFKCWKKSDNKEEKYGIVVYFTKNIELV